MDFFIDIFNKFGDKYPAILVCALLASPMILFGIVGGIFCGADWFFSCLKGFAYIFAMFMFLTGIFS